MRLAPIDRELLGGLHGPAAQKAMEILQTYGAVMGAEEFIAIESAHIDGCLYHGPSTIDFVRLFVDLGGRVRVPTTLNVAAVDTTHPSLHCGPPEFIPAQEETTALHEQLGCVATLTCAPYQRIFRPRLGEHVAWAESNAIVFVNSVLGARTDRYGDFIDLCAALTGRVPCAGLHLDANRQPALLIDIAPPRQARDLYFAAAGYALGEACKGRIAYIRGLPSDATEDELKGMGAAAASSGAVAMFHAEGLTPEARLWGGVIADLPHEPIGAERLDAAIAILCPLERGERVAAMCLGTPHFSFAEFVSLAALVDGRRAHPECGVFVSTSREIAEQIENSPMWGALSGFGVQLIVDTCTYLAPVVAQSGAIVTNSGKYAHYGPTHLQRRVGLMSMDRCVRCAEHGAVTP
ncbi:MAG: aconitase X catalytic domain-containing protein [Sphingopyxis sp.]|nr:aconitase X catalytic domain-containing protein [Sphingopyxis sp.]